MVIIGVGVGRDWSFLERVLTGVGLPKILRIIEGEGVTLFSFSEGAVVG